MVRWNCLRSQYVMNYLLVKAGMSEICNTVIKVGCSVAGMLDDRMFHKFTQSCYKQNDCVG